MRLAGYRGRISVFSADPEYPVVDRPHLSKRLLTGSIDEQAARLKSNPDWDVELHAASSVCAIDPAAGIIAVSDGAEYRFDGAVIACGARARRLEIPADVAEHVAVLREVDDVRRIRPQLRAGGRVIVIGAGVLGCEVAASCRQLQMDVTLIDVTPTPMVKAVGAEVGALIADLHRKHGVDVRMSAHVENIYQDPIGVRVVLGDGYEQTGVLAIAAIGSVPVTEWLANSPVAVDDGVLCDSYGFIDGADNVVAAGDVACWRRGSQELRTRSEHWTNAGSQGHIAGTNLALRLGGSTDFIQDLSVPYFWSDQYDWAIQMIGCISDDMEHVVPLDTHSGDPKVHTNWYAKGELVGAFGVNQQGSIARLKRQMAKAHSKI